MSPVSNQIPDFKIPKNTPFWAIGVTCVLTSVTISFIAVYTTAKSEVQDYLKNQGVAVSANATSQDKLISSIQELVKVNGEQIVTLTQALRTAEKLASELSNKVEIMDGKLKDVQRVSDDCEAKLRNCSAKSIGLKG